MRKVKLFLAIVFIILSFFLINESVSGKTLQEKSGSFDLLLEEVKNYL
ncbi:MAG: hypothetical protein AB1410_09985 [Acidobacteriota bacterium]